MDEHQPNEWLELGEAAAFLGVHFTTLRRWVDAGKAPCFRTPGGRRRFKQAELSAFLRSLHQGETAGLAIVDEISPRSLPDRVRDIGVANEPWYHRLDDSQRTAMRHEGQRLMAVLMQYATRDNGGEVFLEEGQRLAASYGIACRTAGLSLVETVRAFLLVRRSIKDSVYQAGALAGAPDPDTWRLYDRTNTFLDSMLLATVDAYDHTPQPALPKGDKLA